MRAPTVNADIRRRWQFFQEWAGYATPPGRAACALELARAERAADAAGVSLMVEPEPDPDLSWMDEDDMRREHAVVNVYLVQECETCGETRRLPYSLGNVTDPDQNYLRVLFAELASEWLDDQN